MRHPHGCIGTLKEGAFKIDFHTHRSGGTLPAIQFGDHESIVEAYAKNSAVPPIFPVDEVKLGDSSSNRCYTTVNTLLAAAQNCICIGLSPLGITSSELKLKTVKNVYYTGNEQVYVNFIPLNMYAAPLVDKLAQT